MHALREVLGSCEADCLEEAGAEEAVVEEAAFEDEVDEGIGCVPDEEEACFV